MEKNKKSRIALLKYKALFEEEVLVAYELDSGNADLLYHLNFFKNKLNKSLPNQETNFNNIFFTNLVETNVIPTSETGMQKSEIKPVKKKAKHPPWVKKLYKKIVSVTHPDKIHNIKIDTLVEKLNNCYLIAVQAYKQCEYHDLIMVASDVGIDVDLDLVTKYILPQIEVKSKLIFKNKTIIGYQWYHIQEDKKQETLEKYLTSLGFVFTKDEVKNVIKKCRKSKRKVGTRPVKMRRSRLK